MTLGDFDKLFLSMCEMERSILCTKGVEYSGRDDRLANFKRLARDLNLNPKIILWIYFIKHIDSIRSFILTGEVNSTESIEGRIYDARNYLALLMGLIEDERKC